MSQSGVLAIVGGGIVGLSVAHQLQRMGRDIVLIDEQSDRTPASLGNAGHIAVEQNAPLASWSTIRGAAAAYFPFGGAMDVVFKDIVDWLPFFLRFTAAAGKHRHAAGRDALSRLNAPALGAWQRLLDTLDRPDLLSTEGHYMVWETERSHRVGRATCRAAQTDWITAVDAPPASLPPTGLNHETLTGAMHIRGSGQILNLADMMKALDAAITKTPNARISARVLDVEVDDNRIFLTTSAGDLLEAGGLVLAAGVRTAPLLQRLGWKVPLIAERGYHLDFPVGDEWPQHAPMVFGDRSCILTRFSDTLRLASIVEFGSPDSPPHEAKWRRLEKHASELGLPMHVEPRRWFGSRPTLPDYLPAIGKLPGFENIYYAFGHNHLGLTQAPITAECLAREISGEASDIDLSAFSITRFGRNR